MPRPYRELVPSRTRNRCATRVDQFPKLPPNVSVSCWGHENKEKTAERHFGALWKAEESDGSLPIMKMG